MDSNLNKFHLAIRESLGECRQRMETIFAKLAELEINPNDPMVVKTLRHHFAAIGEFGDVYGLADVVRLTASGENGCNVIALLSEAPTSHQIAQWRDTAQELSVELHERLREDAIARSIRILMISNHREMPLARKVWEHLGRICEFVTDWNEASKKLHRERYFAVVVDLAHCPVAIEEVIRRLRSRGDSRRVPVFAVADKLTLVERIKLTQSGVGRFLPSTISSSDFVNLLLQIQGQIESIRGTVFLLETDPLLRRQIQTDLEKEDYKVYSCTTYSELLQIWSQKAPQLLIVNANVQDVNALTLCKSMKKSKKSDSSMSRVQILLMVDREIGRFREKAFQAGVDDYLVLPYNGHEWLSRVRVRLELLRYLFESESAQAGGAYPIAPPAELNESQPIKTLPQSVLPSDKIRVLIADDDRMIRKMLTHFVKQEGWEPTVAENGEETENLLKSETYHFILLDINMPFKSGFDILNWIRESGTKGNTKIIVLTANNEDDAVLRAFSLGADDFVAKPVNPRIVVSRLKRYLEE